MYKTTTIKAQGLVVRYWWVNHKKTGKQEIRGGYLWSPLREANGARSQFYENMRIASAGDAVLSFIEGNINYVGLVLDFASPTPKPDCFGMTGDNWANEGWLLPIRWRSLPSPIRPKIKIKDLAPLLPTKYSPINKETGNGNQKAYLAEISREVFELLIGVPEFENEILSPTISTASAVEQIDDAVQTKIIEDTNLDPTIKQQVILARRGQGLFRDRIYDFENACRLTHVKTPQLLVASHIKPWRVCKTASERLDGANGLLLTPHVDRLFDRGYISFEDNGGVLISSKLQTADLERLGLSNACKAGSSPFLAAQTAYLSYHRAQVFIP